MCVALALSIVVVVVVVIVVVIVIVIVVIIVVMVIVIIIIIIMIVVVVVVVVIIVVPVVISHTSPVMILRDTRLTQRNQSRRLLPLTDTIPLLGVIVELVIALVGHAHDWTTDIPAAGRDVVFVQGLA